MRQQYYHIKYYNDVLQQMKDTKQSFRTITTTYTKRIENDNMKMFFNNDGKNNNKLLSLISAVRNDATRFVEQGGLTRESYVDFFKMINLPKSSEIICKVDVRAAYWCAALQSSIISGKTDTMHKTLFALPTDVEPNERIKIHGEYTTIGDRYNKISKQSRLKALGSLATTKMIQQYSNGLTDGLPEIHEQPTRHVYIEICRMIDELMKLCASEVDGCIYYYWDCVFIRKKFTPLAVEFFKSKGFDTRIDETRIEYHKLSDDVAYLLSVADDKIYMTRREDKHILQQYIQSNKKHKQ